jgi:hypothetical protein
MTKEFNPTVDNLDTVPAVTDKATTTLAGFDIDKTGNVVLPKGMQWKVTVKPDKYNVTHKVRLQKKSRFGFKTIGKLSFWQRYDENKKPLGTVNVTDLQDTLLLRHNLGL